MPPPRYVAGLALAAIACAACSDPLTPPSADPGSRTPQAVAAATSAPNERAGEAGFRALAREVPGFAGFHFDTTGRLVVRLTPRGQSAAARERVLARLILDGRRREDVEPLDVVVQPARYDFDQLSTWRETIIGLVSGRPTWSMIDIDEERNRVRVGVTDPEDVAPIIADVEAASVPGDAFEVVVEPRVTPTQQTKHLVADWRPLIGGAQLGPSGCTLGITARRNGQPVVLTNAHCSAQYGVLHGDPISQPNGTQLFGAEIYDQQFGCQVGVNWYSRCRDADVAAYSITGIPLQPGQTALRIGTIAKPKQRVWGGSNTPGSLEVYLTDPYLEINTGIAAAAVNEVVEKVGIASRWTYGYVRYTCVDRVQSDPSAPIGQSAVMLRCQDVADINMEDGDSGSPVFKRYGQTNTVAFVGIARGRINQPGTDGVYSNLGQLEKALGPFEYLIEPF